MSLQNYAWQSGLVLLEPKWNENDWPHLEDGGRWMYASVVLDHLDQDNNKGQTVVVLGGIRDDGWATNSVHVLNLSEPRKQWRNGLPMNKRLVDHAAVVCNGGIYVIGGFDHGTSLDCIEWLDVDSLVQSPSISNKHWTPLNCRLSTGHHECCAVAVRNRYIVVMGGYNMREFSRLSSVDIIDTSNQTVVAGPTMTVPRSSCASAVVGHRIFVVGDSEKFPVEYLFFSAPCDNEETKKETVSTAISFPFAWTRLPDLGLSVQPDRPAVVAVESCLVVAQKGTSVKIFDTRRYRHHVWSLPPLEKALTRGFTLLTVDSQIAGIGGRGNPSCATLGLMDKKTWCFCQLREHAPNEWFGMAKSTRSKVKRSHRTEFRQTIIMVRRIFACIDLLVSVTSRLMYLCLVLRCITHTQAAYLRDANCTPSSLFSALHSYLWRLCES